MADGSIKFFKGTVAGSTWRALSPTRGGEATSGDVY
jgi:hypothetical protein